jgi:hypothetical protein
MPRKERKIKEKKRMGKDEINNMLTIILWDKWQLRYWSLYEKWVLVS